MKVNNSRKFISPFIYILVALPLFAIGVVIGISWGIKDTLTFTEGVPIICKVTELGINPPATHLGPYAEFEFINDNCVIRERQTISRERLHHINVGGCYLGFHRPNDIKHVHVLFDIPITDTSGTTLTIALK